MAQFSDTSGGTGLIQLCEQELYGDTGFGQISNDNNRLKIFTNYINEANARYTEIAIQSDGRWVFDDSNQTDLPIAVADLVANQQDYSLSTSFIDILGVEIANAAGIFYGLVEVSEREFSNWSASLTNTFRIPSQPWAYMKVGNSIFLLPAPNYNYSGGIKIRFQRPHSYFTYTDTTKTPGFNSNHHQYLVYYACWRYAKSRGMSQAAAFGQDVERYEGPEGRPSIGEIASHYSSRNKDKVKRMTPRPRYRK